MFGTVKVNHFFRLVIVVQKKRHGLKSAVEKEVNRCALQFSIQQWIQNEILPF